MAIKFEEMKDGDNKAPAKPKPAPAAPGGHETEATTDTVALPFAKPVRIDKKRKPKR